MENLKQPEYCIFTLSSNDEKALELQKKAMLDFLAQENDATIEDICFSLNIRRPQLKVRFAVLIHDKKELMRTLKTELPFADISTPLEINTLMNEFVQGNFNDKPEQFLKNIQTLYLAGTYIDWKTIFDTLYPKARKINVPTYQFSHESYWYTDLGSVDNSSLLLASRGLSAESKDLGTSMDPADKPQDVKVGSNCQQTQVSKEETSIKAPSLFDTVSSTAYGTSFAKTLYGNESYISDHVIGGNKILPAAAVIELFRAAAQQTLNCEGTPLMLEDLTLPSPILVKDPVTCELRLKDRSASIFLGNKECYQIKIPLNATLLAPTQFIESQEIIDKLNKFGTVYPELYSEFTQHGFMYGDTFQVLRTIYLDEDSFYAEIQGKQDSVQETENLLLRPALLDGILQTTAAFINLSVDASPLIPYHIKRINIYQAIPDHFYVKTTHRLGVNNKLKIFHCIAFDEQGHVIIELEDFSLAPYGKQATKENILRYYIPSWPISNFAQVSANQRTEKPFLLVCPQDLHEPVMQLGVKNTIFYDPKEDAELIQKKIGTQLEKYLSQLDTGQTPSIIHLDASFLTTCFDEYVYPVSIDFLLVQKLMQHKISSVNFTHAYVGNATTNPFSAMALGFAKTLRLENKNYRMRVIGFPESEVNESLFALITRELHENTEDIAIAYQNNNRLVEKFIENPSVESQLMSLISNHYYLMTGGMGGIGFELAKFLITHYGIKVISIGRRDSAEVKNLDNLYYYQCDVTKEAELKQLKTQLDRDKIHLKGIFHLAGIIEDNLISKKTLTSFLNVLDVKVRGLINLEKIFNCSELDCLVLFSGNASLIGNYGQADYAAANTFLNYYPAYKDKVISISWPLWSNLGMKMAPDAIKIMEEEFGLFPISKEEGFVALTQAMKWRHGSYFVVKGDLISILSKLNTPKIKIESPSQNHKHPLENHLIAKVAKILQINPEKLSAKTELIDLGMDSTVMLEVINIFEEDFGNLPKTLLFELSRIDDLSIYLLENKKEEVKRLLGDLNEEQATLVIPSQIQQKYTPANDITTKVISDEIAIIGLSGHYPGATDLNDFWQKLKTGYNGVSTIPEVRWNYHDLDQLGKDKFSHWGSFLEDVDKFDPTLFGILPIDAEKLDPQARLFLQTAWEVLEDSGYRAKDLNAAGRVGVFVGVMYGEYQFFGVESLSTASSLALSSSYATIANGVSFQFNFTGPSIALDTMCSSSISAIHLACQSLRLGESSTAIAGGVNLSLHPFKYVLLGKNKFTSSDGLCKSFGEGGDGYVPGEGVGAILLKPLSQAIKDNDHIYGIIKGSAINHGGRAKGFTVPNPTAQTLVIQEALKNAHVRIVDINYLEAHGTGTSLGDPIEMKALDNVFHESHQKCPIGSVKSNIGHLESAAGIAALTKVLLQMKHKQLVPSIHSEPANPFIDFEHSHFYVQKELSAWDAAPRIAGISSFGAGGANSHLIIQEYIPEKENTALLKQPFILLPLSAKTKEQLKEYAAQLYHYLEANEASYENQSDWLLRIAHTLQVGREPLDERLVILIEPELQKLKEIIQRFIDGIADKALFQGNSTMMSENDKMLWEDMDVSGYIRTCVDQNKFDKIALLWIKGIEIEWTQIMPNLRKISLPTYPFEKRRCWPESIPFKKIAPSIQENKIEKKVTQEISKPQEKEPITSEQIIKMMLGMLKESLKLTDNDIHADSSLLELGINSITASELGASLSEQLGVNFPPTIFFEFQTVRELSGYLFDSHREKIEQFIHGDSSLDKEESIIKEVNLKNPHKESENIFDVETLWSSVSQQSSQIPNTITFLDDFPDYKKQQIETAPGYQIEFITCGQGQPILVYGGFLLSFLDMQYLAQALAKHYQLIIIHTPGVGASSLMQEELTLNALARDTKAVLDYLNIKKLVIYGCSFGGMLAFNFYLTYPQMVSALIICNSTPDSQLFNLDEAAFYNMMKEDELIRSQLNDINSKLTPFYNAMTKEFNVTDSLEKIKVPCLILAGSADTYTPASISTMIAAKIKQSELHLIEGGTHFMKNIQHEEYNSLIKSFLAKLEKPKLSSMYYPLTQDTLDFTKKYVSEQRMGHTMLIFPAAAQMGFLMNKLIGLSLEDDCYRNFFLTSSKIAIDIGINLARHYTHKHFSKTQGRILIYDPDYQRVDDYNPLNKNIADMLAPNLIFVHTLKELWAKLHHKDAYFSAVIFDDFIEKSYLTQFINQAKEKNCVSILIRHSVENKVCDILPDMLIYTEEVFNKQLPFSVCSVSSAVHAPWRRVPYEGMVRTVYSNYGFTLSFAVDYLLRTYFDEDKAVAKKINEIAENQKLTSAIYAKTVNPGYLEVTQIHGWDGRFDKGHNEECVYTDIDGNSRKVIDFFQIVGTSVLGYNRDALLKKIIPTHDTKKDYDAELINKVKELTGFTHYFSTSSNYSATNKALILAQLAKPQSKEYILVINGNFAINLIANSIVRTDQNLALLFTDPFAPFFKKTVAFDGYDPSSEEKMKQLLEEDQVGIVWLEPIQVNFGGHKTPPDWFFSLINKYHARNKYVLVVDECLTAAYSDHFLNSKEKIKKPDIVLMSNWFADSLVPAGLVMCHDVIYNAAKNKRADVVNILEKNEVLPFSSQLATQVLEELTKPDVLKNKEKSAELLRKELTSIAKEFDFVAEVLGEGLLMGLRFDIGDYPDFLKQNFAFFLWGLCLRDEEYGLAMSVCPVKTDSVRFFVPINTPAAVIQKAMEILRKHMRKGVRKILEEVIDYVNTHRNKEMGTYIHKLIQS